MPTPFVPLKLPQFRQMLASFPFTRTITTVHMHHTFRPNHSQYRGLASIESMHRFHTQERGFSDIAQHITIAPDGTIWTGRNWNKAPASASGHNGNAHAGPFMFEMIGDFDQGKDAFEDPQRNVVLEVIAAVQQRFGLPPDALKFHNQMSPKSCPGTAISFDEIVAAVRQLHAAPRAAAAPGADAPFPGSFQDDQLTGSERALVNDAIEVFLRDDSPAESLSSAEPPEGEDAVLFTARGSVASSAARGVEVTADDLIALRPHVINLSEGQLKEGGDYFTLPQDVERIFSEDMERAFADPESVGMPRRADGHPFRCIVWAHGGLIGERDGLAIARKHLDFWKANGIYPIYFVWETGLGESLGFMLRSLLPGGARGARNFFSDNVSDPMIEGLARAVHAEKIWTSMKRNAELAHSGNGGAIKVASELKAFCGRHAGAVEIHAVGHSAGSIFHSHFLPAALDLGIPAVSSLYLLAPAIRVDHFKERLLGRIGAGIKRLGVFTMLREHEMDDHCAKVYRKSLLYLIRFSLEKERGAEILGLEESLRRDRDISRLLGLNNSGTSAAGDIVFSKSPGSDGQFASQATSHGGFDDDAPTMNSIALRILGEQTRASLKAPYPESSTRSASDPWAARELEEVQRSFGAAFAPPASPQSWSTTSNSPAANLPGGAPAVAPATSQNGRRRALCVGIDRYRVRPLAGCVADARLWERTLQGLGFQSELLVDEDATYANIKARVEQLVRSARAGDVIVWQYAGHGTQVPDVNGDEAGGDSPGKDEAICPVDMHTGRMFTDDEIAALIQELQPGVSFTLLMDCCHSGTLNRFGVGEPPAASRGGDERARFLPLTPDLEQAYLAFARSPEAARAGKARSRSRSALEQTSEVLFTACLSTELAWESNGQGDFTARATRLLTETGGALSNEAFIDAVLAAFGAARRQTPTLACATALRGRQLFQASDAPAPVRTQASLGIEAMQAPGRFRPLADALEGVAQQLRQL